LLYDMQRWAAAGNWMLVAVAAVMLLLEAWMVVEAVLLWPRVRRVMEEALPPLETVPARVTVSS
jgi:carbon starvation protein